MSSKLSRLLVLSVLILGMFSFTQMIQPARAATPGIVCIAPDLPGQTACPATPVALTGAVSSGPATQIRVQIFIQVTDPMNGFDITLLAPHATLVPVGIDLTGSILGTGPTVLAECFQGVLIAGSVCNTGSSDTIDTLHLAAVAAPGALPGGTTPPGSSGILFTAIYSIVSSSAGISIGFQSDTNDGFTNCASTSVPGTCVNISNGTNTPVPETVQAGTFTSTSAQPFLQLSPATTTLGNAFPGTAVPSQTITTTDMNGYGASQSNGGVGPGDATISYIVTITPPSGSATGLTTGTLLTQDFSTVVAGGTMTNTLTISNGATTTPGTWTITVTGIYHFDPNCVVGVGCPGPASTLAESITLSLNVEDFGFTVNGGTANVFVPFWCPATPQGSACPAGQSGVGTLVVTSKGYTGTVTLSNGAILPSTVPTLTGTLSSTTIAGASGTATDTFTGGILRPSAASGSYSLSISSSGTLAANGVFGAQTKTHLVSTLVRPQDYNLTIISGNPVSFNSGLSAQAQAQIGSLPSGTAAGVNAAGFVGTVSLSSSTVLNTGSGSLTVTLNNTAPAFVAATAGKHVGLLVTFSGTATSTATFTVTITGTATLATSSPSTQTHTLTFSVTIQGTGQVPTVTVNNPTPNPATTGQSVSVTFSVSSTPAATGITVAWGDGTTDTLAATATSDTHTYTSTGSVKSEVFTITVTATNSIGSGSGTTSETINDLPPVVTVTNVSPNPANTGQQVTVTFTAADSDGTISSISVSWGDGTTADTLTGTATSDTHTYSTANTFTITVTATDNSGSTGSNTGSVVVHVPVNVPSVTVNTPTPNPANTGATVTVTFTVTSTATVTGITVNWGDGTITDSLPGSATSDTHVYASTGSAKSQTFTITVTATNSAGPGSGQTTETVNDRSPTVTISNVSPNPATTGQLVTVTFTSADPDGTVSAISVNWGDGTALDTLAGTATSDTHTYNVAGPFTITVTATDNSGSTGTNTRSITVNPPVTVPTVTVNNPTPNPANTGTTVSVTFTVSSTVTVTGITVNWGDGSTVDNLAGTATSDTHIYATTGSVTSKTFTITVTATNSAGPGSGQTSETVNDRPPIASVTNVSPNPVNTGQVVTVTFTTSDPDGSISSISVNWGDGTSLDSLSGTSTSDTHTYLIAGSFTITVTATDNSGSTGSGSGSITVQTPVGVPSVTVNNPTPNPANTGQTVTVTFTVSSTVTVTGISVNWGDGSSPDSLAGTATSDTHTYASTGNAKTQVFTITVTATNSAGPGTGQTTETVNDRAPVVTVTNVSPNPVNTGQLVTATFTAVDPDGTISSITINWGDGSAVDSLSGSATSGTHTYIVAGSFTITVTATDNSGSTSQNTGSITVLTPVGVPTVAVNGPTPNPAEEGQTVTVTWTVSSTVTVTESCINWGDGSSSCGLAGVSSSTHVYNAGTSASAQFHVVVNATNSAGTGSGTQTETVNDLAPTVNFAATPVPTDEGVTVSVPFTVSDDEAISKTCVNWGDGVSACGITSPATHVYSTGGAASMSFTITVNATDAAGLTGSNHESIIINDIAPTVTITSVTPNPATSGQTVSVSFTATDDEAIVPFRTCIDWGDGVASTTCSITSPVTHVYTVSVSTQFTITINATDTPLLVGTATATATVNPPAVGAPTVTVNSPTPNPANTGDTVTVTFSVSSTATINGITVSWGDGSAIDILSGSATSDTHVYASTGSSQSMTFTITVTATNSAGSGSGTTTEVVNDRPPVASFTFSPSSPNAGQTVTFDASASADPDGTIVSYSWNFGDGTTGTGVIATHSYNPATNMTFTVKLSLTDNSGSTGSASQSLTVVVPVTAPTVTITNVAPNPANTGQTVTVSFTVSSTITVANVTVRWGDGSFDFLSGSATSDSHIYNSTGTFTITVAATNRVGTGFATATEIVTSPNGAPFLLTFQAFNFTAFHNGIGPFTVLVNGHVVVVFPGHAFVSTSSTTAFGTDKWVSLGPYDITAFVRPGQNNVTFVNTFGIRFSLLRNIMVTQGDTVFLNFKGPRFVSSGHPLTLTFSNPPLVITSFTATGSFMTEGNATFTATYTGGTGPFKCLFFFGDDEAAFVAGGATSCSVTHEFDDSGNFTARVVVIGSSTSDVKLASLPVTVTDSSLQNQQSLALATVSSTNGPDDD